MASSDRIVPAHELSELETVKIPVILTFKDNTFHCKVCRNHTQSRNAFEEHIAAHCQLYPYICIPCKIKYKLKSEMDSHVQQVHKNEKVKCGVKGMKDVEKCMKQLLTQGIVKFKGFLRKKQKSNQTNVDSAKMDSAEVTNENQTTERLTQTQEPGHSVKLADNSEKVSHENDNDNSKTDIEGVRRETSDCTKVLTTREGKPHCTTTNECKTIDQRSEENKLSSNVDSVAVDSSSIDTFGKYTSCQEALKQNMPTHGEETSKFAFMTDNTSSTEPEDSYSRNLHITDSKSRKAETDIGNNIDQTRLSSAESDFQENKAEQDKQKSAYSVLFSGDKLEEKTVEGQDNEFTLRYIVKEQSASSEERSLGTASLIDSKCAKLSSYTIQGTVDGSSKVSTANPGLDNINRSSVHNENFDLNQHKNVVDGSLQQESEKRSNPGQQTGVFLTDSEKLLTSDSNIQLGTESPDKITCAAEEKLTISPEGSSINKRAGGKCSTKKENVNEQSEVKVTTANVTDDRSQLSRFQKHNEQQSLPITPDLEPTMDQDLHHDHKNYPLIATDNNAKLDQDKQRKEATYSDVNEDQEKGVSSLTEHDSRLAQDEQLSATTDGDLSQDQEKQLSASNEKDPKLVEDEKCTTATDDNLSQDQEKQLSASAEKDPKLVEDEKCTTATDGNLSKDHEKQLWASAEKDPKLVEDEKCTTATDGDMLDDQEKQLSATTDKDSKFVQNEQHTAATNGNMSQDQEKQLSASTEKDPKLVQDEQYTATTDGDLSQDQGKQLTATTDKDPKLVQDEQYTATTDGDLSQDQGKQLTATTDKDPKLVQDEQYTATTDGDLSQDQGKQLTATTDKDPNLVQDEQHTTAADEDVSQDQEKQITATTDKDLVQEREKGLATSGKDKKFLQDGQLAAVIDKDMTQNQHKDQQISTVTNLHQDENYIESLQDHSNASNSKAGPLQNRIISTSGKGMEQHQVPSTDTTGQDSPNNLRKYPTVVYDKYSLSSKESISSSDQGDAKDKKLPKISTEKTCLYVSSSQNVDKDETSFKDGVKSSEGDNIMVSEDKGSDVTHRKYFNKPIQKDNSINKPSLHKSNNASQTLSSPVKPSVSSDIQGVTSEEHGHISSSEKTYTEMLKVSEDNEKIVQSNLSSLNSWDGDSTQVRGPSVQIQQRQTQSGNRSPVRGLSPVQIQQRQTQRGSHSPVRGPSPVQIQQRQTQSGNHSPVRGPSYVQIQQRQTQRGNHSPVRGPSPVQIQQRQTQRGNHSPVRGPSPVQMQQRQTQSGNHSPVRIPSPVQIQQRQTQSGNHSPVRGHSPVQIEQRQTQRGNYSPVRGPSPVQIQQRQTQSGNHSPVRGPSPVQIQQRQTQSGNHSPVRGPSPVQMQQRQTQRGNHSPVRGPSTVQKQQRQTQRGNHSPVRGPSTVQIQQRQTQRGNHSPVRGPSPVQMQQRQTQSGNHSPVRGPSPVQMQQRQTQSGNHSPVRGPSPVYLQQQRGPSVRKNGNVNVDGHAVLEEHEKTMTARMSIFNLTQSRQRIVNNSTIADNSNVNTRTNNPASSQMSGQVVPIAPDQINPIGQLNTASAPFLPNQNPPVGQFMTIAGQTDMPAGVTPGPLNASYQITVQGTTTSQHTLQEHLPSDPQILGVTQTDSHSSSQVVDAIHRQQQAMMPQINSEPRGPKAQTNQVPQQIPGGFETMPIGMLVTGQNGSFLRVTQLQQHDRSDSGGSQVPSSQTPVYLPQFVLSQDGTLRPTQYIGGTRAQGQTMNQTQLRGSSVVSTQQQMQDVNCLHFRGATIPLPQRQGLDGNQTPRGPSHIQQQRQVQTGNETRPMPIQQTQVWSGHQSKRTSPVSLQQNQHGKQIQVSVPVETQVQCENHIQGENSSVLIQQLRNPSLRHNSKTMHSLNVPGNKEATCKTKSISETASTKKISKQTSLKATVKIAELLRKTRGEKQSKSSVESEINDKMASNVQPYISTVQPNERTLVANPEKVYLAVQPQSTVKKKDKGTFRKVGPDFLCNSCKIETQSEHDFRRHIWTHFHITKNLCNECHSSLENTAKCQLVMSVIDGLKYGCSVATADAEPVQIKAEPDEDDDVVILEHIPPPKKVGHQVVSVKHEVAQTSSLKNTTNVLVNKEREYTSREEMKLGTVQNLGETAIARSLVATSTDSGQEKTANKVVANPNRTSPLRTEPGDVSNAAQMNVMTPKDCQKVVEDTRSSLLGAVASNASSRNKRAGLELRNDPSTEVIKDLTSMVSTDITRAATNFTVSESGRQFIYQFVAKKKRENQEEPCSKESVNMVTDQPVAQGAEAEFDPTHSERTTGNFYVCGGFNSCEFSCFDIADFYKHLFTIHKDATSFLCVHCGFRCSTPQLLIRHLHSHLKSSSVYFSCCISGCRFQTNLLHDYSYHLVEVHSRSNILMCTFCELSFTSIDDLTNHIQENTLKFVRCPYCKVADTDANLIKQHVASTHPSESRHVTVACEIVCRDRQKNDFVGRHIIEESSTPTPGEADSAQLVQPQANTFQGTSTPTQADTTGRTFESLSDSSEDNQVSLEANISEELAKTKGAEDDHISGSITLGNARNTRPPLSLNMKETVVSEVSACDSTVSPTPSLSHLECSTNEEDPQFFHVDSTLSTVLQKCQKCSFATKDKVSMMHHNNIHGVKGQVEKFFSCPLCPDGMTTIQLFRTHMKSHIGDYNVTMYYCDFCQLVTNTQEIIERHGVQYHQNFNKDADISTRDMKFSFKAFVCDECDFCTTSQEVFDKHAETHVEESLPKLAVKEEQKCPYCIYHTKDKSTFDIHINNMHQKQLNKEKRNRKPSSEYETSKYMKSPPTESAKSSTQPVSAFESLQNKSSTSMEQTHDHRDQSKKSVTTSSEEVVSQSDDKSDSLYQSQVSKRYHCCECSKCFSSTDQLKTHMEFHAKVTKKNYEIRLLKCLYCDYTTTERLWLERHYREQHKHASKSTKQRREVIRVEQGATESCKTSSNFVESPAVVKNHKAFLIPSQTTFPQPVSCCECDFSTRDRATLVIHVTKHPTLYPSFEDSSDSTEEIKIKKEKSGTSKVKKIGDESEVIDCSKKSERQIVSVGQHCNTQVMDISSEDSVVDQDVINLLTDESTDEYEKDDSTSENDRVQRRRRNNSQKSNDVSMTKQKSQGLVNEEVALNPHRKSQDCDSIFRLGGGLLHVKLRPCFSQEKDNTLVCDLCSDGYFHDKYEFHKHLLRHMNLWFFMCGHCDFHCFEQIAMTSHLRKHHKNNPSKILKMEVDDFKNRINQIIHCRKAGVSVSSLISIRKQELGRSTVEESVQDSNHSEAKEITESSQNSKTQNTSNDEKSKGSSKNSPEKDSIHASEKSLTAQNKAGEGKVLTFGVFHKCSICSFKSSNRDSVVRHLGVHSQVNKYYCDLCAFQSSVAGDLSLHMAKRHPEACQNKTDQTPRSREFKELLGNQISKSNFKDISQSEDIANSARSQSPLNINSSVSKETDINKNSPSLGRKKTDAHKTPSVGNGIIPPAQAGTVKTIYRHELKKRSGLYRCNYCHYCSKWGNNMCRHIQCMHNVKVIWKEQEEAGSKQNSDDEESDESKSDVESNDKKSNDMKMKDTVTSVDCDDEDATSDDENDGTEIDDDENDGTEIDDDENDGTEIDDDEKGKQKVVLYTCDVKVNSKGQYKCPLCTAVLQCKSNLYRHGLEVHNADIKEGFTCLVCKKDFRLRTPFMKHLRTDSKCDKPWFLCSSRYCASVFLDRQKCIKHMQKVHSVKKSPTEINTKKLKLEKCVVKGNLLHRPKGERPLRRKDKRTPSKTENKVVDKKEEISPGKEEDKALSKKQEKIPDNLTFSKASDMREIVCGECGIESKGCFAYQLHCNNKHSTKSICCFFCKKFATVSVRHMMYHIIDVHKKMNLKFYHIPKTDKHSKIAYKFTCLFNRKNAILNKSITTTNRLFGWRDAPKRLKRKDRKKSESAPSDKEKKTSASEKLSKASYSARNIDTTDHYKCVAVKGCGFVNQKYDVMHVHIQKHLNYKPFKCGICGMLFHMEQHVKMHHTRLHGPDQKVNFTVKRIAATEEKIARCLRTGNPHYFVNKTFTVEDFKKVRNGPKRLYKEFGGKRTVFKCIECPFESNKKQEMTFHVYKHLPQFYKCPFCNHTGYPRFLVIEHIAEVHPTENASTPVINLMDTNWKRWMKSTSGQKKEPNSASQPDSSDTDVYSGEEARVPCKRRKSAKVSGIPDNILESSDSDIVQPSKKAKVTAGAARKRDRIPSDSEEEDENISRRKCLKRKMSTSSKKASLTSSSDSDEEEDDESEEDIEDSNSVQDTDEKYKEEDDEEGVATPPRRKRHQILSDSTDYGPTHYFCHQCPFHTEDLGIYCRHLVTHGGFNQLCPRLLPKDLQKPVEEELGRFMEGTSKKKGSAFLCAYCNYMAETSFRVKQHIQINHPDNYTDYMEIHTKYDTTNVMLVAMQPSIVMTDICKMDLIDLALMLKHEGVTMNSTKNHPCEKEKSDNTRPSSAGEKKRKKFSIMSPSKYYKKTISHTDVRQAARFSDEKVDEKIRTEDSQTNKGGDCVESRDGGSESTPNLFNALVKLTQEDKNVTEGFENVIAEYLSAEDKNKPLTAKAVNVCNNSQLDCVRSSGTGVNSSKTGTTSSLGRGEPKNTLTSSAMPENCHEDFEIEKNSPNNERSTLNFQEMSFETKAMSNPAENLADQTCEEVKNMVPANVGVTTVSSTTDHVDTSDWSVYSDVSDCSDSILSKDDNLCEEIPAVTERASISFSTPNQSCCSPCSSGCVEGEHSGKQKALPSATSTTKKGGNSLPSEITGDNVMSSIDSMLDSLSDIKHKHVMNSPVKHSSNQKRTHSSDILSSPLVNSTNQHKSKDSNNTTKSLESKDADIIINRPDSQDSDNESCHSIGFEVNTDSQEL